jgi:hypothetical protein
LKESKAVGTAVDVFTEATAAVSIAPLAVSTLAGVAAATLVVSVDFAVVKCIILFHLLLLL